MPVSRKPDLGKAPIAKPLRRETTVNKRWIAEQPRMGSVSNVNHGLANRTGRQ